MGVTSEIQLVDDGFYYSAKNEMSHALDSWFEQDSNLESWTVEEAAGLPMWRKRVLITQLAAK
ncbi:MAG: hypothetical protein SGPRY_003196, partial [Prymnesium sp.]